MVHNLNVRQPLTVYRFFRDIGCRYLGFLPVVERAPGTEDGVSPHTPSAEAYGAFLCKIFDEWIARDAGRIAVQIFEEASRPARGLEHSLCVFRETCGQIPVLEHNGDFFPCDHFVDREHRLGNIRETPLGELLESPAQRAFGDAKRDALPRYCRECEALAMCNGGCPKYRFIRTPDGEPGLNYLCAGLKRFFLHSRDAAGETGIPAAAAGGRQSRGAAQGGTQRSLPLRQRPEVQEMLRGRLTCNAARRSADDVSADALGQPDDALLRDFVAHGAPGLVGKMQRPDGFLRGERAAVVRVVVHRKERVFARALVREDRPCIRRRSCSGRRVPDRSEAVRTNRCPWPRRGRGS